jgi:hypothetical protein
MAEQDHLLRTTNSTTTLGNTLTHQTLTFLDTVSDQPLGFRPLAQDFLSISRILNILELHLISSPLPSAAIPELVKVLDHVEAYMLSHAILILFLSAFAPAFEPRTDHHKNKKTYS